MGNSRSCVQALEIIEQLIQLIRAADDEQREDIAVAITHTIDLGDGDIYTLSDAKCRRLYAELHAMYGAETAIPQGRPAHQPLSGRPLDQQALISQRLAEFKAKGGGMVSPFHRSVPGGQPNGPDS